MGKNSRNRNKQRNRKSQKILKNSRRQLMLRSTQTSISNVQNSRQENQISSYETESPTVTSSSGSKNASEQVSSLNDMNDGEFERQLAVDAGWEALYYEGDSVQGDVGIADDGILSEENLISWKPEGPGFKLDLPKYSSIKRTGRNNKNGLKIECPLYFSDFPELLHLLENMDWSTYHGEGNQFKSSGKVVFGKEFKDYCVSTSSQIKKIRRDVAGQRGVFRTSEIILPGFYRFFAVMQGGAKYSSPPCNF